MPARARLVPLGVALLACVFGARLAPADEDQPTPGAAFDRVVAAFPAPSAAGGFEFRGVLRLGGRSLGHARLAVSPGPDGTWEAQDRFVLKGHAVPVVETSTARLSPQLKLAQGDARTTAAGRPGLAWVRAADALAVSRTGVEQPVQVPLAGSALNTLAATIQFCRLAPTEAGVYATSVFEPESALKGEPALLPLQIEIRANERLDGVPVRAAIATKGTKELTVLWKPDSGEVVAVRIVEGETRVEILPADPWDMAAPDAPTAGLRAMLGFAAKQLTVLDDVLHWPSLHAAMLAGLSAEERADALDVEAWRAAMMKGYETRLEARPVEMMRSIIEGVRGQVSQEELGDGRIRLVFPAIMRGMRFDVANVDGAWHVVALPRAPAEEAK